MSNTINLNEPQVASLIATYTGIRLERGVSSTNLGSFQLVAQIPYVVGQTAYSYVDVTGAASDWYRIARYGAGIISDYSPPWPVTPTPITSGVGARRSLQSCRRMLGRRLGSTQVITTTDDGASDGTTFISRGLANQIDANRYRGWWAMPTDGVSAGEVRVIGTSALNPSNGLMTINPPMLSMIVEGTEIELHKLLPPTEEAGPVIGLRECLNLALAECWIPDRQALTWPSGFNYNVAQLGDWLEPAAIDEVYGTGVSGVPLTPYGPYRTYGDAADVNLEIVGIGSGAAVTIEFTRPADSLIKVAGVWTDQQQGFQNDTDECLLQPAFLCTVAMVYAYEALANSITGAPGVRFQKLADDQRRTANITKRQYLSRAAERPHGGYSVGNDWMSLIR